MKHATCVLTCVLAMGWTGRARAQEPSYSRVGGDTVITFRTAAAEDTLPQLTFHADSMGTVRVAGRLTVLGRTIAWRNRTDSEWFGRLVQLTARYEASGRVGVRLEAGFLGQPVGLSAQQERADENRMVLPALGFDVALPSFDIGVPRLMLPAPTWPLGFQASVSGTRWDARAAIVDSSPLRSRTPLAPDQPAAAAQFLGGGGVSPRPGLRVGGWWSHGAYARRSEIAGARSDRKATLGAIEADFAINHTRVTAEWMVGRLDTTTGPAYSKAWAIEGAQAVTPRWFVAGRVRHVAGPFRNLRVSPSAALETRDYSSGEATIGYRLSREVTLRASATTKQPFSVPGWSPGVATSIVWARRWF